MGNDVPAIFRLSYELHASGNRFTWFHHQVQEKAFKDENYCKPPQGLSLRLGIGREVLCVLSFDRRLQYYWECDSIPCLEHARFVTIIRDETTNIAESPTVALLSRFSMRDEFI
jgi:hypothetical protein